MPPNSVRASSSVCAPSSAARNAATTPAGPAPMTTTSDTSDGGIRFCLGWLCSFRVLRALLKGDVVVENCPWIHRHLPGFLDVELDKRDLVSPDRPQELLDELDR